MQLKEFTYQLPEELIAQSPLLKRDDARLLVVNRKTQEITHDKFCHIHQYLPKNSTVILNNSKVVPARLLGTKERSGGKVEIFLLRKLPDGHSYEVLMKPIKKVKEGDNILFAGSPLSAKVVDIKRRIVCFNRRNPIQLLKKIGHIPLPPYIKRQDTPEDHVFYQTVYARYAGSVAAPTAGLHFTQDLLRKLIAEGHQIANVMLHINYATFKPVETVDITRHKMHEEYYSVSPRVWNELKAKKSKGKNIVAVGTTSCRVLESVARSNCLKGNTDLFIYPGFHFKMVDILITNFHLPLSSLLMLVYAFGSVKLMKQAYQEAIENKYRFYSYGDAMIIL